MPLGKFAFRSIREHGGLKRAIQLDTASGAESVLLTAKDGPQFLLKIYTLQVERDVKLIAELNERLISAGIRVSPILEFGEADRGSPPFELRTWIAGRSMDRALERLSPEAQYRRGIAAGDLLREIHSIDGTALWGYCPPTRREREDRALAGVVALAKKGLPTYKADVFLKYLQSAPGQNQRENCLLHGDFHIGNILEDGRGKLWAIDWIYGQSGDPAEDFVRIFVSAHQYPAFARGQMDGYFGGAPPEEFWLDLKMYAALQQLEILLLPLGRLPDGQPVQEHQHAIVLEQYEGMKATIPKFYSVQEG